MRITSTLKFASAAVLAAGGALAQAPPPPVPPQDNMTACAPASAAEQPRTIEGPALQVEVTDAFGPYRAGETVMVSDANGLPLATLVCEGPWANFRLMPGIYRVMAFIGDKQSNELAVNVPPTGSRVTLKLQPPADQVPAPLVTEEETTVLPPPPPDILAEQAANAK